ncbi:MAG TPA: O-antigen ligase family protein [Solirubrobacteraceae bacterium]|jgi:hypothetical protein
MSASNVLSAGRRALPSRRGPLPGWGNETLKAIAAAAAAAAISYAGMHKFGAVGMLAPVAVALAALLLMRPLAAITLLVALTILCEGPTFGFLGITSHLYDQVYKGLTPLDMLVAVAIAAVGIDIASGRRRISLPGPLLPATGVLLCAMLVAVVYGYAVGEGLRDVVLTQHVLAYLLFLPTIVANMDLDRRKVVFLLGGLMALAVLKAVFGLIEVAGGYGSPIEGSSTLTYYEPTANWLVMIGFMSVCAALAAKVRMPRWMLLGGPLLLTSLVLSYRRSFWIALVLGIVLILLLGVSRGGRRVLLPTAVLLGVAIWMMGSISTTQLQSPIVKRVQSLSPTKVESNVQDSYRLDERANVLHSIERHPITGLGLNVPWTATVRPLSEEHEEGRVYVHFAALWFWMKLGILGLVAYIALILGAIALGFRVWRRSPEPLVRAFGLASLCAFVGLIAIETTASFTGVDPRFTALIAVHMGLLALLDRRATLAVGQAPSANRSSTAVV